MLRSCLLFLSIAANSAIQIDSAPPTIPEVPTAEESQHAKEMQGAGRCRPGIGCGESRKPIRDRLNRCKLFQRIKERRAARGC